MLPQPEIEIVACVVFSTTETLRDSKFETAVENKIKHFLCQSLDLTAKIKEVKLKSKTRLYPTEALDPPIRFNLQLLGSSQIQLHKNKTQVCLVKRLSTPCQL